MKSKAMDPKLSSGIRGRRYFSIRRTSEYPNNEFRGGIALSASRRLRGSGTLSFRIQVPVDIKFNARRSVSHAGTLQVAQTSPSLRLPPYGIHVLRSRFIARTPIKFSRVIPPPSPPSPDKSLSGRTVPRLRSNTFRNDPRRLRILDGFFLSTSFSPQRNFFPFR